MMKKFTLIELMVVVAIIGILMTLLLPSLEKARDASKRAVCLSNQKQMGTAMMMYISANGGKFMSAGNEQYFSSGNFWLYWITEYTTNTWDGPRWYDIVNPIVECPSDKSESSGGYAYNLYYLGAWKYGPAPSTRYQEVDKPSETLMFIDGSDDYPGNFLSYWALPPVQFSNPNLVGNRHFKGTNVLWTDGSASPRSRTSLIKTDDHEWKLEK